MNAVLARIIVKISRSDTNEEGEIEVTVTSEQHAQEYRSTLKSHRRHLTEHAEPMARNFYHSARERVETGFNTCILEFNIFFLKGDNPFPASTPLITFPFGESSTRRSSLAKILGEARKGKGRRV